MSVSPLRLLLMDLSGDSDKGVQDRESLRVPGTQDRSRESRKRKGRKGVVH